MSASIDDTGIPAAGTWEESALRDSAPLHDAVLGTRSPSVIETNAGTWAHEQDFAGRLARVLDSLPDGADYATMIADAAAGTDP